MPVNLLENNSLCETWWSLLEGNMRPSKKSARRIVTFASTRLRYFSASADHETPARLHARRSLRVEADEKNASR